MGPIYILKYILELRPSSTEDKEMHTILHCLFHVIKRNRDIIMAYLFSLSLRSVWHTFITAAQHDSFTLCSTGT